MCFSCCICADGRLDQEYYSAHSNRPIDPDHRYRAHLRLPQWRKPLRRLEGAPLSPLIEDDEQRIEQIEGLNKNKNKAF